MAEYFDMDDAQTSESPPQDSLLLALCRFQEELPPVLRDRSGHHRNKYASLDAILKIVRPALSAHGLYLIQPFEYSDGSLFLVTILGHISGSRIESKTKISIEGQKIQDIGSLITYWRRYAISSLLGVASEEDDDGNRAKSGPDTNPARAYKDESDLRTTVNNQRKSSSQDSPERKNTNGSSSKSLRSSGAISRLQLENLSNLIAGDEELIARILNGYQIEKLSELQADLYDAVVRRIIAIQNMECQGCVS